MTQPVESENSLLKNWHLKLVILIGIISPTATVARAYYGIQEQIVSSGAEQSQRISKIELQAQQSFVNKQDFKDLQEDVKHMRDDLTVIRTLLKQKLR